MRPQWQKVESVPVPVEGSNRTLEILYWPHRGVAGGNHEGEYWVRTTIAHEEYDLHVDNSHFWGPDAENRAKEELRRRTE